MLYEDTLFSRFLNTLLGTIIFVLIVAGGTYYLQNSLILVKQYDAYTHWAVVLLALPILAGIISRFANITSPLFSSLFGAFAAAALLYPQYQTWWAVPPTMLDMGIYVIIVLGIGFMATQPLKTTFMMAFRMGRFSMPSFSTPGKKPARRADMTKTQRLQATGKGNTVAMMELMVGLSSLALSIFSIFFLGKG
ncbi:MAG: hypothetical protein HUJ30_09455 [Gammaproteobacteria bacterium]|nr:hypothetical protein [Gammaproteobacteria bacterium]